MLHELARAVYQMIDNGVPVASLTRPQQVFIRTYGVQGCIDKGGLSYFFDQATEEPYSVFSDAFRTIGVSEVATCIEKAVEACGLREAHLEYEARREWMF